MKKTNERIKRRYQKRFRSRLSSRQQKGAAFTVSLLALIVLASMIATPNKNVQSAEENMTESIVQENAAFAVDPAEIKRDYGNCEVRKGKVPDYPIQSTFTASYPGSGAKMTWKLIEAMTGLVTGDDFQLNGHSNIVSIKTHYPSSEGREINGAQNIPRAMLLIRNPLHSIPSYFNFVYEYENNLPGHSTKAPLEEWIKWRNNNFDRQVQVWRRHTEYWMDAYDKLHRMVISYEKLIDDELGPAEAMKIAEFLNRSDGVTTVPPEEVPCVWYAVIKYKKKGRRLSDGIVQSLQLTTSDDQNRLLNSGFFKNYPQDKKQSSSEQASGSSSKHQEYKDYEPVQLSKYLDSAQTKDNESSYSNYAIAQKEPMSNPEESTHSGGSQYVESEKASNKEPQVTPSSQNGSASTYPQIEPQSSTNEMLENKEFEKSSFAHDNQYPELDQTAKLPQQGESNVSSLKSSRTSQYPELSRTKSSLYPELDRSEAEGATSSYSKEPQTSPRIQSSHYPEFGHSGSASLRGSTNTKLDETEKITQDKRRGPQYISSPDPQDSEHRSQETMDEIQSKRGGPKYIAPYNPQQLKDLIGVLTQLLERYRDDKDLAPILVSFIDEAARRSEGPPEDENTIVVET